MLKQTTEKSKLTALMALVAVMLLLFTGCVRSGVGVVIEKDDTGMVEVSMGIKEKTYNSIMSQEGAEDIFAGKTTTVLTDGDYKYICAVEKKEFKSLDGLEMILLDLKYDFAELSEEMNGSDEAETEMPNDSGDDLWIEGDDTFDEEEKKVDYRIFKTAEITHESGFFSDKYNIKLTVNPQKELFGEDDMLAADMLGIDSGDMFKLAVDVTLPGKLSSETGKVTGNTVSFTVTDFESETLLTAESSTANMIGIVVVAAVVIILLVAAVVLMLTGKKPNKNSFE